MYAVSDGAHHGNPDFFFLSPLFSNPSRDPNFEPAAFNGTLRPAVEICELGDADSHGDRVCVAGPLVKRFAPGTVNVSPGDQQYQVNWNTTESGLNVNKYYRIGVWVGAVRLGFADVDPVTNGSQLKNVQTGEYIGLVDGRTLPIKFRIESGALCGTDGTPCAAQTVNLNQGGGVELTVPGEDFHFDVPPGTQATAGNQAVTEVTFNLEKCDGIDVDLPKFGQCLRVTALYDAPGAVLTFTQPILISMCSFVPVSEGQQELVTLHQQDGDLIRALPHAHPNCNVIGANDAAPAGLLARSWQWMKGLVTPAPLLAETRNVAMLHLGGGGETTKTGATCTPPPSAIAKGMFLTGTCTSGSGVAPATPFPRAGQTISDFQFALPAKMDYVDPDDASRSAAPGTVVSTQVKVTDWFGAAVQGATVKFTKTTIGDPGIIVATSNSDGVASASWTIRTGANTFVASGRGIAAQNNYPGGTVKPFMPDIFSTDAQSPVVVNDGEIPFLVTGILPAPALVAPSAASVIPQNNPGIGCSLLPGGPGRGYGYQIPFDWADVAGAASYEIFATDPGATLPIVNTTTTSSQFTLTSCNAFVADGNLTGWQWHVRAKDAAGNFSDWSETRVFDFAPCRLPDDSACRTTPITGLLTDPQGDAGTGSDAVWATGTVAGGNLTLSLRFAGTSYNASTFVVWSLDTDQNTATGFPGITNSNGDAALLGVDFIVQIRGTGFGSTVTVLRGDFTVVSTTLTPTFAANGVDVTIPLSLLDGDDGIMNFKATIQTQLSPGSWTGINDFISNLGAPVGTVGL